MPTAYHTNYYSFLYFNLTEKSWRSKDEWNFSYRVSIALSLKATKKLSNYDWNSLNASFIRYEFIVILVNKTLQKNDKSNAA